MANHEQLDAELNGMILSGQVMDAFEKFYADDVVMQENLNPEIVGKEACRQHELEFFSKVEAFHGAQMLGSAAKGDVSYSEWIYDVTFKGAPRTQMTQIAARRWKDGKLVRERFYYDGGH
jgi:ketosteroid isomerase-like protein